MYTRPYFFNLRNMWTEFPLAHIDGTMKWYYLAQFGFWLQQIIVVNIEERRKDYAQMFTHHIFTCALIFFSYGYYQTKVGNVVLCIMDLVDILLSVCPSSPSTTHSELTMTRPRNASSTKVSRPPVTSCLALSWLAGSLHDMDST